MQMLVEAVASHKQGIKVGGKWFSADKFAKPDFTVLSAGSVIDAVVMQDKFIKSYTFANGSVATAPQAPTASPSQASTVPATASYPANAAKDASIARAVALKAGIDLVSSMGELGIDEAVSKAISFIPVFEKYLLTGQFE